MRLIDADVLEPHGQFKALGNGNYEYVEVVYMDDIRNAPTIEPERKKGEWIFKDHLWECNQCGCRINREHPLKGNIWNYNFCPNCGAEMKEGEA